LGRWFSSDAQAQKEALMPKLLTPPALDIDGSAAG
jgi:hypothetical protein